MTKPRHAAYSPRKMVITVITISVLLLLGALVASLVTNQEQPTAAPAPQPTATWTTYIPTTPVVCRDAMDTADEAIRQGEDRYESTLKAAQLGNDGKPGGAEKQIKIAQEAHEDLTKTIQAYIKKARECRK